MLKTSAVNTAFIAKHFYNWKKKYSGMDATQLSELKALKEKNARLKKMYAELAMDNVVLKDVIQKSSKTLSKERSV